MRKIWRGVALTIFGCSVFADAVTLAAGNPRDYGTYHALLISNENYAYWGKLKTPHNDTKELYKILTERYGFDRGNVTSLRDVTRGDIIDELERLRGRLTDRDNLLIYYAGHGKLRDDGGYWVGVNARRDSRGGWLHTRTISELIDINNGMRARHVLIVADSCYSGALFRSDSAVSNRRKDEARDVWMLRMRETRARTALTSGGEEPVVDRAGGSRHSIFAQELISRLRDNSEILDADGLYDRIKQDVHERARRIVGRASQAPGYGRIAGTGHAGGDFLFVPRGARINIPSPGPVSRQGVGIRGEENVRKARTNEKRGSGGREKTPSAERSPLMEMERKQRRQDIIRRWTGKIRKVEERGPHGDCDVTVFTPRAIDPAEYDECESRNVEISQLREEMRQELRAFEGGSRPMSKAASAGSAHAPGPAEEKPQNVADPEQVSLWKRRIKEIQDSGPHGDCDISVIAPRAVDPAEYDDCVSRNMDIEQLRRKLKRATK